MASGIPLNEECSKFFKRIKVSKDTKKKANKDESPARFMVMHIAENKEIKLDFSLMETATDCDAVEPDHYMQVIRSLPADDARYVVYDYDYEESYGRASKLILILWTPETVPIKSKMVYAASKGAVKTAFGLGDHCGEIHADCLEDITPDEIKGKLRKV